MRSVPAPRRRVEAVEARLEVTDDDAKFALACDLARECAHTTDERRLTDALEIMREKYSIARRQLRLREFAPSADSEPRP